MDLPGDTTNNCASLTTTKCILNSTISTPGARFITHDMNNFYYNTPMGRYEYMKISLVILPEEIIAQYNLLQLASDGWVYLEIHKGMPGLKQADRIANDRIKIHLPSLATPPLIGPLPFGSMPPKTSASPLWSTISVSSTTERTCRTT